MMAIPSARSRLTRWNSFSVSREESAVVGSSMTRILAFACSARAISTNCWLAIESEPTTVLGPKGAPRRSRAPFEFSIIPARSTKAPFRSSSPRWMFSATVRFGARLSSW